MNLRLQMLLNKLKVGVERLNAGYKCAPRALLKMGFALLQAMLPSHQQYA